MNERRQAVPRPGSSPSAPPDAQGIAAAPRRGGGLCVRRALAAARDALARDEAAALTLPDLATKAAVSPRTLQRHFARILGRAPRAVVQGLRLDAARQTLRSGEA
ncbi:MAG: helix-turn-helix domain-containing protein, partial [Microvirga sp.]